MSEVCVRVAVRIRPLLPKELLHKHEVCVKAVPGSAQVKVGSDRLFSFDHVFGPLTSQDEVYESCVQPLVESLVHGYNATVFCYGQTGSGKTYTLGGGGNLDKEGGIIDRVALDVFLLLEEKRINSDGVEASVRVSYMELYREELRDLLELHTIHKELHIREDERGNTVVVGAKEVVVTSVEELISVLDTGNALRHTTATGMNEHSSRSHAILTIQLVQCCHSSDSSLKSVRSSKLCLVDLAGSERAGKTGNTGTRLKESVYINTGLLALGNVIRALSDPARYRRGNNCNSAHIPYRDAKITRLLRDSLGGTAHTLMVACVSPSDYSVAETLSVLQFASKARHIRNCPAATSTHTEVKSCPATSNPGGAQPAELEYEIQRLRELLKEKEREIVMERERTNGGSGEGGDFKQPSQVRMSHPDKKVNQEEPSQCCTLAQEAAALLADISGPTPSPSFRQRLQDWQERLTAVNHSHQADNKDCSGDCGDQPYHVTIYKLREELNKYKEALTVEEQLLEQKDRELGQIQKEVETVLQESKTHLQALEEEKERNRIQTEQLVDQQILINHLRSDLMTFRGAKVEEGASGNSGKRPHSVPLIRHSCVSRPSRRIHSSPPAYSLERVMAAFKMRSHLLLAEIEEKDEVYCPFIKPQTETIDGDQEKEEEEKEEEGIFEGRMGFRRSLNRTWTSRQKKSTLKEKNAGLDQTFNENPLLQQPQRATGTKENDANQSHMRRERLRASLTQRRIRDLSVNMHMKEELIKELENTGKDTQALGRHGRHSADSKRVDVLARLSLQRQQVQAEVYHSLEHMRLQRAQLQTSLRQQRDTSDKGLDLKGEQRAEDMTLRNSSHQEESKEKLLDRSWLEDEEERVIQKRAELQELEEELRRREEVLLRREACLQQKNKLETKMLRSSQALSQDLLRVSVRLESLEEQLRSSSGVRRTAGVTIEELEEERDMLKKRRDTLDAQLKDNRVLTVEEEHSLLQLEEAIEALDAALEFKNRSIRDKQKKLLITDSLSRQPQSNEPAHFCDVIRKLKELSTPEASELLIKYFNKVVCLREVEHHLRLRCKELELHAGEQEAALRGLEFAMQHLTLDTDRRLTQQHRDHQNNIQLLLQKLKEGGSGEAQQAIQERLQHLEKELFFYKSSSRQLKKKLRECLSDAVHPQPLHTQKHRQTHCMQIHASANEPQTNTEEVQTSTHITTTYTKIHTEQTDKKTHSRLAHQTPSSSSSDLYTHNKTEVPEYNQIHTQSQGRSESGAGLSGESLEMTPVRLCRRELRQISAADLQVYGSATRRRQSVVDTSTETILEDSIEVPRNTDI